MDSERLRRFLAAASQFRLGRLVTEQPHPLTADLSRLAVEDPAQALRLLHRVDREALATLQRAVAGIEQLAAAIAETLGSGRDVHLCGCGATGRLALACETIWRHEHAGTPLENRVHSFMAGGDVALIRSIEGFEDHPEFGSRQLAESGFADGDLLVACTEGGETPFVIGATLAAADTSSNSPWFLYCNPDDVLCEVADRSRLVIEDARVRKLNLSCGPMAVSGSTRMQASTVLMAAAGMALLYGAGEIRRRLDELIDWYERADVSFLAPFVVRESAAYAGHYLLYETVPRLAITVLTDTTERSPTFSMVPFENDADKAAPWSLCHLYVPAAADSREAWERMLMRPPRTLEWSETGPMTSSGRLYGFDFSARLARRRGGTRHRRFTIGYDGAALNFALDGPAHRLELHGLPFLSAHLVLKMLLNMQSTLVMGRLGRYDGNIMTWVRPANNKLVDRAIRYADAILKRRGVTAGYGELARCCFELMETAPQDQSLVGEMVNRILCTGNDQGSGNSLSSSSTRK